MKAKCEHPNHLGSAGTRVGAIYYRRERDGKVCRTYFCDDCTSTYADDTDELGDFRFQRGRQAARRGRPVRAHRALPGDSRA